MRTIQKLQCTKHVQVGKHIRLKIYLQLVHLIVLRGNKVARLQSNGKQEIKSTATIKSKK